MPFFESPVHNSERGKQELGLEELLFSILPLEIYGYWVKSHIGSVSANKNSSDIRITCQMTPESLPASVSPQKKLQLILGPSFINPP